MSKVHVRPVTPENLEAGLQVLRQHYRRFNGVLDRLRSGFPKPGLDACGRPVQYFVAEHEDRVVAVAGIGGSGVVMDWGVSEGTSRDAVAAPLLQALEERARQCNAESILLCVPKDEAPSESLLFQSGYRKIDPPATTIRVLDFAQLLRVLAQAKEPEWLRFAPFTIHLVLAAGAGKQQVHICLKAEYDAGGVAQLEITKSAPARADVCIQASTARFSAFILGTIAAKDFFDSSTRIDPRSRSGTVRSVLGAFRLDGPWYTPICEHL